MATATIDLGTVIVNIFSRSSAVLAMAAATVNRIAPGRLTLGVGPSTPKAIEDLHGIAYDQPVRRIHETARSSTPILVTPTASPTTVTCYV